jgi:hypothetical protein
MTFLGNTLTREEKKGENVQEKGTKRTEKIVKYRLKYKQ